MREPDFSGDSAKGWRMEIDRKRLTPDQDAGLATWMVNGPGWHPAWSWWMVGVVHLRELPGVSPPVKHFPQAEHEIMVVALDPAGEPDPDKPVPQPGMRYLTPVDLMFQFEGLSDEQAVEIGELVVRRACEQNIPLDRDFRRWWTDSLTTTVGHYKEGRH